MKKKVMGILLAVAMLVTYMPSIAFAATGDAESETASKTVGQQTKSKKPVDRGDFIKMKSDIYEAGRKLFADSEKYSKYYTVKKDYYSSRFMDTLQFKDPDYKKIVEKVYYTVYQTCDMDGYGDTGLYCYGVNGAGLKITTGEGNYAPPINDRMWVNVDVDTSKVSKEDAEALSDIALMCWNMDSKRMCTWNAIVRGDVYCYEDCGIPIRFGSTGYTPRKSPTNAWFEEMLEKTKQLAMDTNTDKMSALYNGLVDGTLTDATCWNSGDLNHLADKMDKLNYRLKLFMDDVPKNSRYDAIVYIHDYIAYNCSYYNGSDLEMICTLNNDENVKKDLALLGGTGSRGYYCDGVSVCFAELCAAVGIDDVKCCGSKSSNHGWNKLKMDDGKWYWLDVTDDDPSGAVQGLGYTCSENHHCFLRGKPEAGTRHDAIYERDYDKYDSEDIIDVIDNWAETDYVYKGHTEHELVKVNGCDPTCQTPGMKTYYKCTGCLHIFSDKDGLNEVSYDELKIPRLSHELEYHEKIENCTSKCIDKVSCREYWRCKKCGRKFRDAAGNHLLTGLEPPENYEYSEDEPKLYNSDLEEFTGNHRYVKLDPQESTCTEEGIARGVLQCKDCERCFMIHKNKETDETENSYLYVEGTGKDEVDKNFKGECIVHEAAFIPKAPHHYDDDGKCVDCGEQINGSCSNGYHSKLVYEKSFNIKTKEGDIVEVRECPDCRKWVHRNSGKWGSSDGQVEYYFGDVEKIVEEENQGGDVDECNHEFIAVKKRDVTCKKVGIIFDCYYCTKCLMYYDTYDVNQFCHQSIPIAEVEIPKEHNIVNGKCTYCNKPDEYANCELIHYPEVEPSCEYHGTKEYWQCRACGKLFSDDHSWKEISVDDLDIPCIEHNLVHQNGEEATCAEAGFKESYKCSECGDLFDKDKKPVEFADLYLPHLKHKFDKETGKCTNEKCTEEISKHKHALEIEKSATGTVNYVCETCGATFSDKDGKNQIADFVAQPKTKINKYDYSSEHKLKRVSYIQPTCTGTGMRSHYVCTDKGCGKIFADKYATKEMTKSDVIIPKLGHYFFAYSIQTCLRCRCTTRQDLEKMKEKEATCTEGGTPAGYKLTDSNKFTLTRDYSAPLLNSGFSSAKGHKYKKVSGVAATCLKEGRKEYWTCVDCGGAYLDSAGKFGTTLDTLALPKAEHNYKKSSVLKKATVFEDGLERWTCSTVGCGQILDKAVSKLKAVLTLNKSKAKVKRGKSFKLKAKKVAYGDSIVKFKSSKKKIATVSKTGVVKGKKKGKAVITVWTKAGAKKTCKVTVK